MLSAKQEQTSNKNASIVEQIKTFDELFTNRNDTEIKNILDKMSKQTGFFWHISDKQKETLLIWAIKTGHFDIAIDIANRMDYVFAFAMYDNNNKTARSYLYDYLAQHKATQANDPVAKLKQILDSKDATLQECGKNLKTILLQFTVNTTISELPTLQGADKEWAINLFKCSLSEYSYKEIQQQISYIYSILERLNDTEKQNAQQILQILQQNAKQRITIGQTRLVRGQCHTK